MIKIQWVNTSIRSCHAKILFWIIVQLRVLYKRNSQTQNAEQNDGKAYPLIK